MGGVPSSKTRIRTEVCVPWSLSPYVSLDQIPRGDAWKSCVCKMSRGKREADRGKGDRGRQRVRGGGVMRREREREREEKREEKTET
jgi:hypothetical protein